MRAIFFKNEEINELEVGNKLIISDGQIHHLKNVVRIEKDEIVLGLDGIGLESKLKCLEINKKEISFEILSKKRHLKTPGPTAAIGILKKDAMEDVLKLAVELGMDSILFLKTKYSQRGLSLNEFRERYQRVMESSLLQSNNYFFPNLIGPMELDEFLESSKKNNLFFYNSSKDAKCFKNSNELPFPGENFEKIVLVLGPEGGFSEEEQISFENRKNVYQFKFNTPILRTQNALAVARGHLIGLYANQL